MIRKRIRFCGQVHGVGFRWRASCAAERYRCTGWCKNEWDGSVLMEIQGEESAIDQVILSIQAGRYVEITKMDAKTIPVVEDERSFYTE